MNAAQAANSGAAIPENPAPRITTLAPDYFDQIMPDLPIVCGRQLKPLSIGRYRRMYQQKVSFVSDSDAIATVGDLLKGVIICSMTCEDLDNFIASKHFRSQLDRFARRTGFLAPKFLEWPIVGGWISKIAAPILHRHAIEDAEYLTEQMEIFAKYIKDGSVMPQYWNEGEEGRSSAAHWSHCIESILREKQNWTKREIDEEPLTKALWDYFKTMETAGLVRLMSAEEAEEISRKLTPEQEEESRIALEKLWRYKFGDAPMPTEETAENFLPPQ